MNVISIDHSKRCTGIFSKHNGSETSMTVINKANLSHGKCLINIYRFFSDILSKNNYHFAFMEGYAFVPKHKSGHLTLAEVTGVIKLAFAEKEVPIITVPISTWKSIVKIDIDKKKKKNEYLQAVKFKYGKDFGSVDEADAYLIYQSCKYIAGTTKILTNSATKIRDQIKNLMEVK